SGRIVARLGLGIEGVLDASLPAALPPTVYAQLREIPIAVIVAVALLLVIRRRVVRRAA
ncbi:MAG: apolipoprotein N-acyltransferase, partial [Bradyrhizobium sp.]